MAWYLYSLSHTSFAFRSCCGPSVFVEHLPYTARRRWHIDVAQSNTTVESVGDRVDDRWWRADGTGLTRTLDAQWVGCRRHIMG